MRSVWLAMALMFGGIAAAQVGPSAARTVDFETEPPRDGAPGPHALTVEVFVDADGRVQDAKVVEPSGVRKYDAAVVAYVRNVRFMPAVSETGALVPGSLKLRFRSVEPGETEPASRLPKSAFDPADFADRESNRLRRMRCRDLAWEVDFMRAIAPKKDLTRERLFLVSFAMYVTQRQPPVEQQQVMLGIFPTLVGSAVESCRANPDALWWEDAFAPTLDATRATS